MERNKSVAFPALSWPLFGRRFQNLLYYQTLHLTHRLPIAILPTGRSCHSWTDEEVKVKRGDKEPLMLPLSFKLRFQRTAVL